MDRSRYRTLFVAEARRTVADAAGALSADAPDARTLLRAFHTLKGMSATMGLGPVVALAHAVEDLCHAAAGDLVAIPPARPLLEAALDRLREQVDAVEAGLPPEEAEPLVRALQEHLRASSHTGFRLLSEEPPLPGPDGGADEPDEHTGDHDGDTLVDILAACARLRRRLADDDAAEADLACVTDGVRRLHRELSALRGVPFSTIAAPLRQRLRAVCTSAGCEARLELSGGATRLDPAVLGPIQAALLHLLDNALVHGIEPIGQRGAKSPVGRIRVRVSRAAGRLHVVMVDDGRGLDSARLRGAAGEPSGDPVALALRSGLSTLACVGAVAGRGEGLPAAAALVHRLGGDLDVQSRPGRGTRVFMRVPMPLAPADPAGAPPLPAPPRGSS